MWMIELAMNTITAADSDYRQPERGDFSHGFLPMMR